MAHTPSWTEGVFGMASFIKEGGAEWGMSYEFSAISGFPISFLLNKSTLFIMSCNTHSVVLF